MLRNLGIISILLFSSHSLAIAQQRTGSDSLVCKNSKGTIQVWEEDDTCRCSVAPTAEDGYTYTKGIGAHKFYRDIKTWNQAEKFCRKQGAHLAILDSDAEKQLLLEVFNREYPTVSKKTSNSFHIWLGIHDRFEEGLWTTVSGDDLEYKSWAMAKYPNCYKTDQPDNGGGGQKQHCGSLVRSCNYMDDVDCEWLLPFFCEKPLACA